MVWSSLPATGVQLRMVLTHSHTAHMPQPTMCSPGSCQTCLHHVEKCIKTAPSCTPVAGKGDQTIDMQNTQTLAKHTQDTVEILVSPMLSYCLFVWRF